MFKEERDASAFLWKDLGDLKEGRPTVGQKVHVLFYRLMQFALRDALITRYDTKAANDIFIDAGRTAGREFCRNMLNTNMDFGGFLAELQSILKESEFGILTIEKADIDSMEMTIALAEDIGCSGLPVSHETFCVFDEGFFKGIMEEYTKKEFYVKEVDCWGTGAKVCRFKIRLIKL